MKNRREFLSTGGRIAGSIVLASGIKLARAMQAAQKLTRPRQRRPRVMKSFGRHTAAPSVQIQDTRIFLNLSLWCS